MFEGKYNSAPCPKDTMSHRLLAPFISARGYPIFGLTLSPNKKESPPTDGRGLSVSCSPLQSEEQVHQWIHRGKGAAGSW